MGEDCQVRFDTFTVLIVFLEAGQVTGRFDAFLSLFQNDGGLWLFTEYDPIKNDHSDRGGDETINRVEGLDREQGWAGQGSDGVVGKQGTEKVVGCVQAKGKFHAIVLQGDEAGEEAECKIIQSHQDSVDGHFGVDHVRNEKQNAVDECQQPFVFELQSDPLQKITAKEKLFG